MVAGVRKFQNFKNKDENVIRFAITEDLLEREGQREREVITGELETKNMTEKV